MALSFDPRSLAREFRTVVDRELSFDRQAAFADARRRCVVFCETNSLVVPTIVDAPRIKHHGYYIRSKVRCEVNVMNCVAPAVSDACRSWSYPGYSADRTPLGVTTHELGHHWHYEAGARQITRAWRNEVETTSEQPVTSYGATSTHEDIAETLKLFITNPSLLAAAWPTRYEFVRRYLTPIETRHWREILADSPRHVLAASRKILAVGGEI